MIERVRKGLYVVKDEHGENVIGTIEENSQVREYVFCPVGWSEEDYTFLTQVELSSVYNFLLELNGPREDS